MIKNIAYNILAKLFQDGFKHIEKIDWMTKVLEICHKNTHLVAIWPKFLDAVDSMLDDAKDEIKQAREWLD